MGQFCEGPILLEKFYSEQFLICELALKKTFGDQNRTSRIFVQFETGNILKSGVKLNYFDYFMSHFGFLRPQR